MLEFQLSPGSISQCTQLLLALLILLYLEPTTFMVKLIGVCLVTVLAVLGTIWYLITPAALVKQYRFDLLQALCEHNS